MLVETLHRHHDLELAQFLNNLGNSDAGASVLAYHYPFYHQLVLKTLGERAQSLTLAIRSSCGKLKAVLPGIIHRCESICCYNSLPFFGPNGGVLADASCSSEYHQLCKRLTQSAIDALAGHNCLAATFYSEFSPWEAKTPNPTLGHTVDMEIVDQRAVKEVVRIPKTTLYLPLEKVASPEKTLHWPAKIRYDLRKAAASGVKVVTPLSRSDENALLEIYSQCCLASGAPPKPHRFLLDLLRSSSDRFTVYGAKLEGELIAALVVLWGPQTASYFLPATRAAYRTLQPGSLLIDRACKDALRRGIRFWNFESSPSREGGVFRFKRKWGSKEAGYTITVVRFCEKSALAELGPNRLAKMFPYFFVYPYHALQSSAA